jgi:hypothetical protein
MNASSKDIVSLLSKYLEEQGLSQTHSALQTELRLRRLSKVLDKTGEHVDTITESTSAITEKIRSLASPKSPEAMAIEDRTMEATVEEKVYYTMFERGLFPYLDEGIPNLASVEVVLLTYQSFTTSMDLLYTLLKKYYDSDTQVQLRVIAAIEEYMVKYYLKYESWECSGRKHRRDFLSELWNFVNGELQSFATGKVLREALTHLREKLQTDHSWHRSIAKINLIRYGPFIGKNFDNTDTDVIANHLTIIERLKFASIEPQEFLNLRWSKPKTKHLAPNILLGTQRFDKLAFWMTSLIVTCQDFDLRVKRLEKIINIATYLFNLKNYANLLAILAGIRHTASYKLKKTFNALSPSVSEELKRLQTLTGSNYSKIRAFVQEALFSGQPAVPFLGYIQTDLTFIEEGNKESLINRSEMTYKVLSDVILLQDTCAQRGATIELDYEVMWVLESQEGRIDDEDELHKESKMRE